MPNDIESLRTVDVSGKDADVASRFSPLEHAGSAGNTTLKTIA